MFCFCLQSSLLKLQALEVEGGPSLGPSPEESPPALDSKEPRGPGAPAEPRGKTLAVCHPVPTEQSSPPELLTILTRPPQSPRHQPLTTTIQPGQQPLSPEGGPPPGHQHCPYYSPQRSSPGGEGRGNGSEGGGGGGGALLQLLAGGPSPLPSPRCSSPSLRFNSDPDSAPSPPCSQQYILCRGGWGDRTEGPEDQSPPSIPFLTRQIQTLKKRVRRFEDQFELEMNYKPSHNDKYSNPEMVRVMNELAKARKQLKELRLRQSVFESKEPENSDVCRYSSGQQGASEHKPVLEETVESLFRRLREKRQALGLPDNMKEMTQAQMVLEKITLQKCLLYFESLHGRPGTKQEKNLVKPLYDRYQMIKHLLCASPTINTIEEEDGSDDEDSTSSMTVDEVPPRPPPRRASRSAAGEEDSDRDSDPAFVSPIDEVKAVRQKTALTTENLHEASRSQLLDCLRETRAEKKTRRKALKEFEDEFYRQTGRICQKEDRTPMKEEYQEYKQLKAKLRLLEVLLSKQDATKSMGGTSTPV